MNPGRRPRLLVVWLVFVVLVGAVILIERSDLMAPEDEHGGHEEREVRMLMPAPAGAVDGRRDRPRRHPAPL